MKLGLYIEPQEGLGNRMRAIDSALFLALDIDKPLRLVWTIDKALGCAFEDLFTIPDQIASIETISLTPLGYQKMQEELQYLRNASAKYISQNNWPLIKKDGFDFLSLRDYDTPYISTRERFYPHQLRDDAPSESDYFTQRAKGTLISAGLRRRSTKLQLPSPYSRFYAVFRPIESLHRIILSHTSSFRHTIGLHLRRTDNPQQQNSPTELFVKRMKQEIELQPKTDFFLATDDPAEEVFLTREFSGRIRVHPKRCLDRSQKESIEDALIDLYCLAETNRIIGTTYSSFTVIAARINRIPLEVLKLQ